MNTIAETTIEADPKVPVIRMSRDFTATPEQLFRAHTDPELFAQWVGPRSLQTRVIEWDARTGGSWRYVSTRDGEEYQRQGEGQREHDGSRSRERAHLFFPTERCEPMDEELIGRIGDDADEKVGTNVELVGDDENRAIFSIPFDLRRSHGPPSS